MTWADGRMLAFDVETTAPDPEEARIVQAAQVFVGDGRPTDTAVLLVNPGVPIPEGASAVHGITDEIAATGMAAKTAVDELAHMLEGAIDDGVPVVAFNARYDLTVLDRECARHGCQPPDWSRIRVIDPFVIDKWLHRFRRGSRKLADVCAHYGVDLGEHAHDAGADALAAARLAYRLLHKTDAVQGRHPEIVQRRTFWKLVRDDLDALHSAQVGWAREQAIGLRSYFEGRGEVEKAASVSEDWPLIPAAVAA